MMNQVYGYIRVSTKEQNEDRQKIALDEFHVPKERIYMDKLSGKDFNRPQYKKLLRKLKEGDVLVVKKHRPAGKKLRRNIGPVADLNQGETSGYCSAGHAPSGYTEKQ